MKIGNVIEAAWFGSHTIRFFNFNLLFRHYCVNTVCFTYCAKISDPHVLPSVVDRKQYAFIEGCGVVRSGSPGQVRNGTVGEATARFKCSAAVA